MSYAEAPLKTVQRFSNTWGVTNVNSLISEFLSISKETNREPDSYHFLAGNEDLTDPNTGKSILNFISEGLEKDIARNLRDWTLSNKDGMALWISPRSENYPCAKIIIHRIAYSLNGEKVVLNSAILFDGEIENSEYKRGTLYTLPDREESVFRILKWIEKKSGKEINIAESEKTSLSKAVYFADQIQAGVSISSVIDEMQRTSFLGGNPLSCSVSFSDLATSRSSIVIAGEQKDQYGSLTFKCPNRTCPVGIISRPPGTLLKNCPHCGTDIRCG